MSEWGLTSESPLGAPAILFSPDSIGLSEATVGASSSYSPPRGIVYGVFFFTFGVLAFLRLSSELKEGGSDHSNLLGCSCRFET